MTKVKRILGILWLVLAAAASYFCVFEFGLPKFFSHKQEDLVFGIIILFILTPLIVSGLDVFGYFAIKEIRIVKIYKGAKDSILTNPEFLFKEVKALF